MPNESGRWLRCPKCGGVNDLALTEVHEEYGTTDPGRIKIQGGRLVVAGDFWFSAGDPVRVVIECNPCGHHWRSRKSVSHAE